MATVQSFTRLAVLAAAAAAAGMPTALAQVLTNPEPTPSILRPTATPDEAETTVPIRRARRPEENTDAEEPRRRGLRRFVIPPRRDARADARRTAREVFGEDPLSDDVRLIRPEDADEIDALDDQDRDGDDGLLPPRPLSARANTTSQLDNPPSRETRELQRQGATRPERRDRETIENVSRLPDPPVYGLSEAADLAARQDADTTVQAIDAAEDADPITTGAIDAETEPDPALGLTLGWLRLFPLIDLRGGATTNAGGVGDADDDARLYRIAPELRLQTLWARHEIEGDVRANYTISGGSADTDEEIFAGRLRGRLDVTSRTTLEIEGTYDQELIQRGNTGAPTTVVKRPHLRTRAATGTLTQSFNRVTLALRGGITEFDYENAGNRDGTSLDNGDLDFRIEEVNLRGTYEISPKTDIFAEVFADREVYERKVDSGGTRQGSEGLGVRGGVVWRPTPLVELNAAAGYEVREPNDPGSGTIREPLFEVGALWQPTTATTVDIQLRQSLETSNEDGTSDGVLIRDAELQVTHRVRPAVTVTAGASIGRDTFNGSNREDDRYGFSAGILYQLNRYLAFVADIFHDRTESNVAGESDDETQFSAGIRARY